MIVVSAVGSANLDTEARRAGFDSHFEFWQATELLGYSEVDQWAHFRATLREEKEKLEAMWASLAAEVGGTLNGSHCLSKRDGSRPGFVKVVKTFTRELKSFKHIETQVMPMNEFGHHTIIMTYHAPSESRDLDVRHAAGWFAPDNGSFEILALKQP